MITDLFGCISLLVQKKIYKDFTARKYIQANGYTAEVLSETKDRVILLTFLRFNTIIQI